MKRKASFLTSVILLGLTFPFTAEGMEVLDSFKPYVFYTYSQPASTGKAEAVLGEMTALIDRNEALKAALLANRGRLPMHDTLLWYAAGNVDFDQAAFVEKFPALYEYCRVLLVSDHYYGDRRVIYQLQDGTLPSPRMIYGSGNGNFVASELINPTLQKDSHHPGGWINDFVFRSTPEGPYLLSVCVGRQTTGNSTVRRIYFWVKVEAERLVAKRFEAYDVPPGMEATPAYLKIVSEP